VEGQRWDKVGLMPVLENLTPCYQTIKPDRALGEINKEIAWLQMLVGFEPFI